MNPQKLEVTIIGHAVGRERPMARVDLINRLIADLQLSITSCPRGFVLLFNRGGRSQGMACGSPAFGYVQLSSTEGAQLLQGSDTRTGQSTEASQESIFLALQEILLGHLRAGQDLRDRFTCLIAAAICILAERRQWFFSEQRRTEVGGLARWQEARAKSYMEDRLGETLAVDNVARLCGMSTAHFSRAFKISVGVPPYRWLVSRRIEYAKGLLSGGSMPLADISMECGFTEQSHFTNTFRREVGMTPGAWRQTHRPKGAPGQSRLSRIRREAR